MSEVHVFNVFQVYFIHMRTLHEVVSSCWLSAIRERAEDEEGVFPVPRHRVKLWSFTYRKTSLLCPTVDSGKGSALKNKL
jgi:hypothetical protein